MANIDLILVTDGLKRECSSNDRTDPPSPPRSRSDESQQASAKTTSGDQSSAPRVSRPYDKLMMPEPAPDPRAYEARQDQYKLCQRVLLSRTAEG